MSTAPGIRNTAHSRTKALIVPREHGAWGILLVPLVTGACVGFRQGHGLGGLVLFLTATLALFWLRTPLEILLGSSVMRASSTREKRIVCQATFVLALLAGIPLYVLLHDGNNFGLLFLGATAGAAFALQAIVKLFGRKWRMPAQMIGAIGLTSTAAGAYYVVTGRLDTMAYVLWFVNWAFAGDQIHYVQLRLHNSKVTGLKDRFQAGWLFLTGQFVMLAAIAAIVSRDLLPIAAVLAFLPITLRGIFWLFQKRDTLDLQWLGLTELLHAITFGVLIITSFYVPR